MLPLLIIICAAFVFMPLSLVSGQTSVQVVVTPTEGRVGDSVSVQGSIITNNGAYQVWFGNQVVVNGTATGIDVLTNFAAPETPAGSYNITLVDVSAGTNGTSSGHSFYTQAITSTQFFLFFRFKFKRAVRLFST